MGRGAGAAWSGGEGRDYDGERVAAKASGAVRGGLQERVEAAVAAAEEWGLGLAEEARGASRARMADTLRWVGQGWLNLKVEDKRRLSHLSYN